MATSGQQVPTKTVPPNAVGRAFVDQYYRMLHESPQLVHKFYKEVSKFGRPEPDGKMGMTTTMTEIDKKILSLGYSEISAEIISMDAQESYGGGVIVLVTGFMIGKDDIKKKFTQCFFLAPQEKGYFVLNDVFRYVEENEIKGSDRDIGFPAFPENVKVMKEGAQPSPKVKAASVKPASEIREQQSTAAPPPSMSETNDSIINTNEGGNNQETEAEGLSIYVKDYCYISVGTTEYIRQPYNTGSRGVISHSSL